MNQLSNETKGYVLAFVGVVVFALTLPITRWVVRADDIDSLSPLFITVCRAAIAGLCGLTYLYWQKALVLPRQRGNGLAGALVVSALGTALAFPLFWDLGWPMPRPYRQRWSRDSCLFVPRCLPASIFGKSNP